MKNHALAALATLVIVLAGCDETNHNDIQSNSGDSGIHVEAGPHGANNPGSNAGGAAHATTQSNTPTPNTSVGTKEQPAPKH